MIEKMRCESGNSNPGMEKHYKDKKERKVWCSQGHRDMGLHKREEIFRVGICTLYMGGAGGGIVSGNFKGLES